MENAVAVHSQMFSPNVFIVGIFSIIIIIIIIITIIIII